MAFLPNTLPENTGLAFRGETAWPPAQLTERQAQTLLSAPNRCGRPNHDVLRRRLAVVDAAPAESWQIDFPAHLTDQEAALYEKPFARLAGSWRNPYTQPDLRRALARLSRYFAMPADADTPDWLWVEDEMLPDASLVVVARDDDFTHGILSSTAFAAWYQGYRTALPPERLIESFPFPWPVATPLGQLTRAQQDLRSEVVRAVRGGNQEQVDALLATAYGWPAGLEADDFVARLLACSRGR